MSNYIGEEIYDFYCNGFFGRRYDLSGSRIEAQGSDYIVIRTTDGHPSMAYFEGYSKEKMNKLIESWMSINEDEE
jgi:hypothetical protein